MQAFNSFSNSTGLKDNLSKCMVYIGNVDQQTNDGIQNIIEFKEGPIPFRYLGIPLTSRNILVGHCLLLFDRIMARIGKQSSCLLSFAGRKQLIINVLFAIAGYGMQYILLPKIVITKIEAIWWHFLKIGYDNISRKYPITWQQVCAPKKKGGLNIIAMVECNHVFILKLLWNINSKIISLWIKWIHYYHVKKLNFMTMTPRTNTSWIMKFFLKQRDQANKMHTGNTMVQSGNIPLEALTKILDCIISMMSLGITWLVITFLGLPRYFCFGWLTIND